ncbi:ABC transporter ATP-binding protein [Labrys miyagiensis]
MSDAGAPPLLELEILRKTYGGRGGATVEAVRNLALSLPRGEFVCLIGPSGCGKTTCLRILLGLDRDFEGSMRPDPAGLSVGVVFQEPRLLPWRSVEQNIRLAMPLQERSRNLDDLFSEMGLSDRRSHFPGALSLGLARRASLARALAVERELLVLDEPFVSLDDKAAQELRNCLLAAVSRHRIAVLMVTHNLREALELADRLVFLGGPPASIREEVRLTMPRRERTQGWIADRHGKLTARLHL